MSLQAYSKCSIQFIPNGKSRDSQRNYSDTSVIELRQHDYGSYSLRGVDVENKSAVIFNFQLKKSDAYKFGSTANYLDRVQSEDGNYYFLLNPTTRDQFHQALRECLEQLNFTDRDSTKSSKTLTAPLVRHNEQPFYGNSLREQSRQTSFQNQSGVLVDIHQLNEYIEQGDVDMAAKILKQLASQGVQLQAKISEKLPNEKMFPIRVRIDGSSLRTNNREEQLVLNVYKSTTICELRAVFEHTHKFPSSTQYFFINGSLVDENASMNDLNIQSDSIFVLFLIQQ